MHRKYEINCQVLFGDHHVVPFANGDFLLRYSSVDSLQPNRLWFIMICRKKSLNLSAWFTKRNHRHAEAMKAPCLDWFFIQDVEEDNKWEQRIPTAV
jgi:hypothetical protein